MVDMADDSGGVKHIGDSLKKREKEIEIVTNDPVLKKGFTQIPNFVLEDPNISLGAKVAYSLYLKYAWFDEYVFPGQERLAGEAGVSKSRFSEFTRECSEKGLIEIKRRGLGRTNLYKVYFRIKTPKDRKRGVDK